MDDERRTRRRFTLEVEDAGGKADAPCEVRFRRLLKEALRRWGFTCVRAAETMNLDGPAAAVEEVERR